MIHIKQPFQTPSEWVWWALPTLHLRMPRVSLMTNYYINNRTYLVRPDFLVIHLPNILLSVSAFDRTFWLENQQ